MNKRKEYCLSQLNWTRSWLMDLQSLIEVVMLAVFKQLLKKSKVDTFLMVQNVGLEMELGVTIQLSGLEMKLNKVKYSALLLKRVWKVCQLPKLRISMLLESYKMLTFS